MLNIINHAHQALNVEADSFTSKEISLALVAAQKRGGKVRLVADQKASSHYSAVTFLARQGVLPARLNDHHAIMHDKVILADDQTLETGSFNFSSSTDKHNAENVLVVRNQPQRVAIYQKEFERLWLESQPFSAAY
ncbi:phospholipase D family protein [Enterobacteriaceae bacterium LUAb1]